MIHRSGRISGRAAIVFRRGDGDGDHNGDGKQGDGGHDGDHCSGGHNKGHNDPSRRDGHGHECNGRGKPSGNADYHMPTPGSGSGNATTPSSSAQAVATASALSSSKGFSPIAAGFIGAVLSFVVVSAVIWGTYFCTRRRRARKLGPANELPPPAADFYAGRPVLITPLPVSQTFTNPSTSTLPYFISAQEAVAREDRDSDNPFARSHDPREVDPFTAPFEWKAAAGSAHPSHTLSA